MKKKFVAFALLISAIVSVSSGCMVESGYGGHGHGGGRGHGYGHGGHHYHNGY